MERRRSGIHHVPADSSPRVHRRSSLTSDQSHETIDAKPCPEGPLSKARKVSRACDFCKSRKAKCSGDQPCSKCVTRGGDCLYNAKYTRGRPPTPPPSAIANVTDITEEPVSDMAETFPEQPAQLISLRVEEEAMNHMQHTSTAPSRASPELGPEEIQGQIFDPTSGLTFLHRAWKRLSDHKSQSAPDNSRRSADTQPTSMAGDRTLPTSNEGQAIRLPDPVENRRLLTLYFDVCIATYRILYRPVVEKWLAIVEVNVENGKPVWKDVGHARAAIIFLVLAVASVHDERSKGVSSPGDHGQETSLSDESYGVASHLIETEKGYPRLESAQSRLIQVLYLLTTSRYNQAWYIFGNLLSIISTLGLHRRQNSKRRRTSTIDYINLQCRMRTFWTSYILDKYLGVIFGRPRHFHDDDIDQDFPDRVHDEQMTPTGPANSSGGPEDCHMDALIFHAKIAQLTGVISQEVYSIKDISAQDRAAAARRAMQRIEEWHASLPLHLGSIPPSMLIPSYRRQATVLRLAHAHAIMHAGRLFLLENSPEKSPHADKTISAAQNVLTTVDYMAQDGPIFHAFWWTHYVTFCALVVVYVWEIQQRKVDKISQANSTEETKKRSHLLELAERCHIHLSRATATNSPSRRYAVILEEFRAAAESQDRSRQDPGEPRPGKFGQGDLSGDRTKNTITDYGSGGVVEDEQTLILDPQLLDEWQTTDWLELDSSAFWPQVDFDESLAWPGIG